MPPNSESCDCVSCPSNEHRLGRGALQTTGRVCMPLTTSTCGESEFETAMHDSSMQYPPRPQPGIGSARAAGALPHQLLAPERLRRRGVGLRPLHRELPVRPVCQSSPPAPRPPTPSAWRTPCATPRSSTRSPAGTAGADTTCAPLTVRQLRHHFGPFLAHFSAPQTSPHHPPHPPCALLYLVPIDY